MWQPSGIRLSRSMPLTLENLNNSSGFSGSDTCMLEMASGLAQAGHGVRVMVGGPTTSAGVDGICYLTFPILDGAGLADLKRVDTLILSYFFGQSAQELFDVVSQLSHPGLQIWLWCQSLFPLVDVDFVERLTEHFGAELHLVGVSGYAGRIMQTRKRESSTYCTILNGLNPDVFEAGKTHVHNRPNLSFAFTACYERGGRIAELVHATLARRGLVMGDMSVSSYCNSVPKNPSLSKKGVADMLHKSDYMVYPLSLDDGRVHHDTYACVVLEAMACGALVVTWDVACLRDVYGDLITLVPTPPCQGYDRTASEGSNPLMLSQSAIETLADAVAALDALPTSVREARRSNAQAWALSQTWASRVSQLVSLMDALSPPCQSPTSVAIDAHC